MITEEQIKKLKPGDPLTIHGTFERIATDGDICIKVPMSLHGVVDNNNVTWAYPSAVAVTKRRYEPCRLFKKGDVVEPKQVKGRVYSKDSKHLIGKKCIVFRDEDEPGYVVISHEGKNYSINTAYLELITPVEELKPYSVLETDTINGFDIMRDGLCVMTFPYGSKEAGYYRNELAAKEAAEIECNRLNNLYKQELENNGRI
jgi:hypothetical protein